MAGNLSAAFWALAGLGAAAAALYGLFYLNRRESLGRAALKTIFMVALAAAFVSAGAPWIVLLALAAAAIGDFVLAFDNKSMLPFRECTPMR